MVWEEVREWGTSGVPYRSLGWYVGQMISQSNTAQKGDGSRDEKPDDVSRPAHYSGFSNGAEAIDIAEHLPYNLGNVVKYVARAGRKTLSPDKDLQKAFWYLTRELAFRGIALPDISTALDDGKK